MSPEKSSAEIKFAPAQAVPVGALVDYQIGSIVSREIVKGATGRVTLFAFDKGEGLSEHTPRSMPWSNSSKARRKLPFPASRTTSKRVNSS